MIGLAKNRWLLPLGVAITVILVAAAGVLAYDRFLAPAGTTDVPARPDPGPTAKDALRTARDAAERWREDAELAGAQVHYAPLQQGQQGSNWSFQFYSPSTGRLGLFLVVGGEATLMRDTLSPYELPTFSQQMWRVDSDRALSLWWEEGGSHLVTRRPDSEVSLRLRMSKESPHKPVWTVAGSIPGQQSHFVVEIDAGDGSMLDQPDS